MTDLDQLREVGDLVSPPAFDSLRTIARKRSRRARIVTATATLSVLAALGSGVVLADSARDSSIRPARPPSPGPSVLPDGALRLPATPDGQDPAPLEAGRYQVPLSSTLAFEVDLPQGTTANSEGLYLQSSSGILKVELAGKDYGVPSDPCQGQYIQPVGRTVQDLVQAIRHEPIYRVSRPEPVTIGGAHGTTVRIRIPAGYNAASCESGQVGLPGNPDTSNNVPPGYVGDWWILDVHGQRVVAQQLCDRCTADQRDLTARQVRSITFPRPS
jgi:hypothetical protein